MARNHGGPFAFVVAFRMARPYPCPMWQTLFGIVAVAVLAGLLARQFAAARSRREAAPQAFFAEASAVLQTPAISAGETVGTYVMTGEYHGHAVQVKALIDTLAVRKLPSLWLLVTIPEPLPVTAIFDLMMRPAGPATFSNFDRLPVTIERPPDFPEHAVVRTDDPVHLVPAHVVAPHLEPFFGHRAKELLITPKGIRMVVLMAEGDRARYGVFRQAEFGEVTLERAMLTEILERLLTLRASIDNWHSSLA